MKMMLNVVCPPEPFNTLVREGNAGKLLGRILDEIKPESAYFTEEGGKRASFYIIEVANASEIPKYAEPFFLNFNAECRFRVLMTPEDLKNAGLEELGKKWA